MNNFGIQGISDFSDRFNLQKTVYFLQQFGGKTHFEFKWFHHGPYSSDLADTAYSLRFQFNNEKILELAKKSLTESDIQAIRRFKDFKQNLSSLPGDLEIEQKLELLASLIFLSPNIFDEEWKNYIKERIHKEKPDLLLNNYDDYWNYLKSYNLI